MSTQSNNAGAHERSSHFFTTRPALSTLLRSLHSLSKTQEGADYIPGAAFPSNVDSPSDLAVFQDRLVALEEDKAQAVYMILRAMNAQRIFEAGTSYGVSLLYLLAAMRDNVAAYGAARSAHGPKVWGTENEAAKVSIAYEHVRQGFSEREEAKEMIEGGQVEILQGDIRQTTRGAAGIEEGSLDALLLDIWAPLALPTLQALEPALRIGAVLFIDNSVSGADRYADLLAYLADQQNGWQMVNLPYSRGFGFAVKFGGKAGKR